MEVKYTYINFGVLGSQLHFERKKPFQAHLLGEGSPYRDNANWTSKVSGFVYWIHIGFKFIQQYINSGVENPYKEL